jgi:hypothetical protein
MEPVKLVPTWRNARSGKEGISKRLDNFFMAGDLLSENFLTKSLVGSGGFSDHLPILLKLEKEKKKPPCPLKFNHDWL